MLHATASQKKSKDIKTDHEYVYIVKASATGRDGTILCNQAYLCTNVASRFLAVCA